MPQSDPPRPRAATCEDCDEDAESILPGTRTSANVAVRRAQPELRTKASYERRRHDGSDSGYSSKAGTIDSDLSGPRKMKVAGLTIKTAVHERERQPYSITQARPDLHRQSSTRPQSYAEDREPPRPPKFRHPDGDCEVCNHYGYHRDVGTDVPRSAIKSSVPTSPQKTRPHIFTHAEEGPVIPRVTRRLTAPQQARPTSMYASAPIQYQYQQMPLQSSIYSQPLSTPLGWGTPFTPTVPYSPVYTYQSVPIVGPQIGYVEQAPAYEYFDTIPETVPEIRPPKLHRRSTLYSPYGEPVIRHASAESKSRPMERQSSSEQRPTLKSHKSSQSQDHDRAMMPPPARPDVHIARRPELRKPTTDASTSSNRRTLGLDVDLIPDLPPVSASRERHTSPSRPHMPPNSYRGPPTSDPERPDLPQKSQSYSTPTHATKNTSSDRVARSSEAVPRRTTISNSLPRERHEDEAEAYQRHRSSLTSNDLMAEAMRKNDLPHQTRDDETASSKSHKSSGHASSGGIGGSVKTTVKLASGHTITTDGDVSVDRDGNMNIVTRKDDDHRSSREPKRIERAPSVASRTSRVSAHSGSLVSSGKRASFGMSKRLSRGDYPPHDDYAIRDEKYLPEDYERRPSGEGRPTTKGGSRRQSQHGSREPSRMGRGSIDQTRRRGSQRDDEGFY